MPEFSDEGANTEPQPPIELVNYLNERTGVNPDAVLIAPHIPPLLGGIKSSQFLINGPGASPDVLPSPDARVDTNIGDLSTETLPPFIDLFQRAETQADAQYPFALFETQQYIADAAASGQPVEVLFTPDTVNSSATAYFRRLERLAQDTGVPIVLPVADVEGETIFAYYKEFEPIRPDSVAAYWEERACHVGLPETFMVTPPSGSQETANALAAVALPVHDYWEGGQDEIRALDYDLRIVANAPAVVVREHLGEGQSQSGKLSLVRQLALDEVPPVRNDDIRAHARQILAKMGNPELLRTLTWELHTKTGGYGNVEQMGLPLGILMRDDPLLLADTVKRVEIDIASDEGVSRETLTWLGALYHTYDPRLGELFAHHLTNVPDHHRAAYGRHVLHAATTWLPMYTAQIVSQAPSLQCDISLAAIHDHAVAFLDDYLAGRLEDVCQAMTFKPPRLADMILSFHNPADQDTLRRLVVREFEDGGSVLTDITFEQMYVQYREQYGDIDEISRHFHIQE